MFNKKTFASRLEEAYSRGDPVVAAWVAEDENLQRLVANPAEVAGDRSSRLLNRIYRDVYRLRRSRQGGRKPDLVTFKWVIFIK